MDLRTPEAAPAANPNASPNPDPAPPLGPGRRPRALWAEPEHWYDDEAGPLVRLFSLTRGRAGPVSEEFDLIAMIRTVSAEGAEPGLVPEAEAVLERCRSRPCSVAEIAADSGLPLGLVRILLGELLDAGLIRVNRPVSPALLPDERTLLDVINGLRAL